VVATIIEQLGEVYDVGAACPKRVGVPHIVDADELAEPAGPTGLEKPLDQRQPSVQPRRRRRGSRTTDDRGRTCRGTPMYRKKRTT